MQSSAGALSAFVADRVHDLDQARDDWTQMPDPLDRLTQAVLASGCPLSSTTDPNCAIKKMFADLYTSQVAITLYILVI